PQKNGLGDRPNPFSSQLDNTFKPSDSLISNLKNNQNYHEDLSIAVNNISNGSQQYNLTNKKSNAPSVNQSFAGGLDFQPKSENPKSKKGSGPKSKAKPNIQYECYETNMDLVDLN